MLAAAMGGMGAALGNAAESAREFKVSTDRYKDSILLSNPTPPSGAGRARFAPRAGGNQRQRRKDRRRIHAAGGKKAFSV